MFGKWMTLGALVAGSLFATAGTANAVIVLDFEGLGDQEQILDFYNGGTGSLGSGPGTNFGIAFGSNALSVIDADAGGTGNIGGEPSPDMAMFFLTGSAVLNLAAGFDTGFSFFYSAINQTGSVDVYDGLNATGSLLATLFLPLTPFNGAPDPTGAFSPFIAIGVGFAGIAKSVDFGGTVNQIAFDDITFGSVDPGNGGNGAQVPEPATLALFGFGLAGMGILTRRRRKKPVAA